MRFVPIGTERQLDLQAVQRVREPKGRRQLRRKKIKIANDSLPSTGFARRSRLLR
jgi:hypothetical protein